MFQRLMAIGSVVSMLALVTAPAQSEEAHIAEVKRYVAEQVVPWITDKMVIEAIKKQNEANASLTEADIKALDDKWRAQADAADKPFIDAVMARPLSKFLREKSDASAGLVTELFVMDAKGLNVGQSHVTSDYWQGDEAKWQKTFLVGPSATYVGEIEKDASTQALQVQISVSIKDPDTGEVIGAATAGIDVTMLLS